MADTTGASSLDSSYQKMLSALASGNQTAFQEAVREFNLNYTNAVADQYGQNFGVGQPAPSTASTLAAGTSTGGVGYIPGFTGLDTGQTINQQQSANSNAQGAAGLTGFYNQPLGSQYAPGTFLRIDPSTYDYATQGEQLDYVTSSGQLQRVTVPQAQAMGYNGNVSAVIPYSTAATLEAAPPSANPQQTLQSLTAYSNLNTAAQNNALAQAGVTGLYSAPAAITPPGTNKNGGTFSSLPAATQQAYYYAHGGDWQAAMQAWVNDSNNAIDQAVIAAGGTPTTAGQPGNPQQTLQAQQQFSDQANQLANLYGQYYSPLTAGQSGVAGVNTPNPGQQTLAAISQAAQLSGMYNGSPTETAREFNANLANSLINAATQLRGPQDYLQYQQLTHGGQSLLSQLQNGTSNTSAQPGQTTPASLNDIISALGIGGPAAGNATTQPALMGSQLMTAFGLSPTQQSQTQAPGPMQINPGFYDQLGSTGQALTKNLYEGLGYDPTDFENTINSTRPVGAAAPATGTKYQAPKGLF